MVLLPKGEAKVKAEVGGMEGSVICGLYEEGRLQTLVEEYTAKCHAHEEADGAQKSKRRAAFPNIAGFCRYIGTGISDFYKLQTEYPHEYDRLLAIFEDEALNSDISSTMLSSYIKMRLLYSFEDEENQNRGEIRYCFEHDIFADGE